VPAVAHETDAGSGPLRPETELILGGRPDVVPDGPLNMPISPASALHPGGASGYARGGSPAWEPLEAVVGGLEGGHAVAFASGMAAAHGAFRLFPSNPTVVAPDVAYMAVRESLQLEHAAGRARIRSVDITDTDAVKAACEGANVLWLESPTNPLLGIADLPELCGFARDKGILVVVDNTLATPLGQRPLALGADVVMHSGTKAIGGHSDLLMGLAVARARELGEELHEARHLAGATPGALETFLCLRGLRTLSLRLERSQQNASILAERLEAHDEVHEVRYPGLASHPQHALAQRTMSGPGFMLTFRVHGGPERADSLVDALRVLTHATSLGGVETLIERRARYPAERHIPADLLRVSVGCEHVEDLWDDLDRALRASVR
jgi:cystathionine gamma-synthase